MYLKVVCELKNWYNKAEIREMMFGKIVSIYSYL